MRNYDRVNTRKPEGIDSKKAYIVGGGIAGLSAEDQSSENPSGIAAAVKWNQ